jgi:hypothetical protein
MEHKKTDKIKCIVNQLEAAHHKRCYQLIQTYPQTTFFVSLSRDNQNRHDIIGLEGCRGKAAIEAVSQIPIANK